LLMDLFLSWKKTNVFDISSVKFQWFMKGMRALSQNELAK